MRSSLLIALVAVVLAIACVEAASSDKLQIGVRSKPKDCPVKASNGDSVHVHYTGTLKSDGSEFDSSVGRGTPFKFTLGQGMVIKGWDQGILGMCIGEKRKLVIPSDLAYGDRGSPPKIPAKATLVFEVELVSIDGKSSSSDL